MTTTFPVRPPAAAILADRRLRIVVVAVAVLAFVARFVWVVRGPGLHGMGTYDDGVYFASAAAMAAGRMPYRDFLLIQPPMLEIVLLPFAAAARIIGDANAFVAARIAFFVIGALNTALIATVLRRFGIGAAVVGGVFYALFPPAIYGERSTLLEPIGTLGVLIALALLGRSAWSRPRLVQVLAGLALAVAVGAKLWYLVPAVIVLVAFWRQVAFVLIGAVAGGLAIFLPFFVAAPAAMWRQLVLDQLGRPDSASSTTLSRLRSILGAPDLTLGGRLPLLDPSVVGVLLLAIALALAIVALTVRGARVFAVMFVVDLALLLESPSYFGHYAALTAPPLALVLGVAVARLARLSGDRAVRGATYAGTLVAVVAGITLFLSTTGYGLVGPRAPVAAIARAVAPTHGCVTADDPTILALTDRLTPDLERGCPLWPDVTGYTYDSASLVVDGRQASRPKNPVWQRAVLHYLTSGDVAVTVRPGTGLSTASEAVLDRGQVLYRHGVYAVRTVTAAVRRAAAG